MRKGFTLVVVLLCSVAVMAGETPRVATIDGLAAVTGPGVQVAIDPVTGLLRQPTAEEARVLAKGLKDMVNDSNEGLETIRLENGAEVVDLQGHFQNVFVMFVDPESEMANECLNSSEQTEALIASIAASATSHCGPKD